MPSMVAVPKTYKPGKHIIVPRHEFWQPSGLVDEQGQSVSLAHFRAWAQDFLSLPLLKLIEHSQRHQDDPTHYTHADAHEAFHARVRGTWHIDRYDAPVEWYAAKLTGCAEADMTADRFAALSPDVRARAFELLGRDHHSDSSEFEDAFDNLFTTNGVNTLFSQAVSGSGTANTGGNPAAATAAYNTTQARIGVGDNATGGTHTQTVATAADTDLNTIFNGNSGTTHATWKVVSGAPTITTNLLAFAASYLTTDGNFAWNEFAADNCGGSNATSSTRSGGTMLDHVISSQGTKTSANTWNPTLSLSVS